MNISELMGLLPFQTGEPADPFQTPQAKWDLRRLARSWAPQQEQDFQSWYGGLANRMGLNPNPDDPAHWYDYRGAFEQGLGPIAAQQGRFPSEFKQPGHPREVVNWRNTTTGWPELGGIFHLYRPEENGGWKR